MIPATKDIEKIIRKYDLTYDQLQYACRQARKNMNLTAPKRAKKLPVLLTDKELQAFMAEVTAQADLGKMLIFDLMLYSGLRISEVLALQVKDIYPNERKILVKQGKGSKDRYVLYPQTVRFKMDMLLKGTDDLLFRSPATNKPITARTVQNWCKTIADKVGIDKNVHPHLFRHHFATGLKAKGMPDEHVACLMGHSNVQSTKTYTHLTPEHIRDEYDRMVRVNS